MKQVITTTGISITNANPHRLTSITEQMNQVGAKFDGFPVDGDQSQTGSILDAQTFLSQLSGKEPRVPDPRGRHQMAAVTTTVEKSAGTNGLAAAFHAVSQAAQFSRLATSELLHITFKFLRPRPAPARRKPLIHNGRKYKR